MPSYLDSTGLSTLWAKIKSYIKNNGGHVFEYTNANIPSTTAAGSKDLYVVGDIIFATDTQKMFVVTAVSSSSPYYTKKELKVSDADNATYAGKIGTSSAYETYSTIHQAISDTGSNSTAITNITNGTTTVGKATEATNVALSYTNSTASGSVGAKIQAGTGTAAIIPVGTSSVPGVLKLGADGGAEAYDTKIVKRGNDALTANNIVLGNGSSAVKPSSVAIATSSTGVTDSDSYVPTSKAVLNKITSQVNAQIKTYVVDKDTDSVFNSQQDAIGLTANFTDYKSSSNGTSITYTNLKVGDMLFVRDTNLPDRWVSQIETENVGGTTIVTLSRLETYDLSGFVLTSAIASKGSSNGAASKTATSITTDTNGALAVTYSDIAIGESQVTNLTTDLSNKASSTHVHGKINNAGKIDDTSGNAVDIANNDCLVITDSSDNHVVKKTTIKFDGSTTGKYLSQKGTWVSASFIPTSVLTNPGDMIAMGASAVTSIPAPTITSGSTPVLSCVEVDNVKVEAWVDFTPISDATINALS